MQTFIDVGDAVACIQDNVKMQGKPATELCSNYLEILMTFEELSQVAITELTKQKISTAGVHRAVHELKFAKAGFSKAWSIVKPELLAVLDANGNADPAEDIDATVRRKFLKSFNSSGSQNDRATKAADSLSESEWCQFKAKHRIGKDIKSYFYKLVTDCDGERVPKWLVNLK